MRFEHHKTGNGNEVDIPISTSYRDCLELLKSDYSRIHGRVDSPGMIWLKLFRDRTLKHLFWLRLASYRGCFYPVRRLRHEHYKLKYDCHAHAGPKVDYGLYLGHAMSMCVSTRYIIGNNASLSQMSNIGTNEGNQAIIGNNVYIGPMTCLIEGAHIGESSLISVDSVVTKNVYLNSAVVGNPCRVIGENKHFEYIQNRWLIKR